MLNLKKTMEEYSTAVASDITSQDGSDETSQWAVANAQWLFAEIIRLRCKAGESVFGIELAASEPMPDQTRPPASRIDPRTMFPHDLMATPDVQLPEVDDRGPQ